MFSCLMSRAYFSWSSDLETRPQRFTVIAADAEAVKRAIAGLDRTDRGRQHGRSRRGS